VSLVFAFLLYVLHAEAYVFLLFIASVCILLLFLYWLYRLGVASLVVGIVVIALGLFQIAGASFILLSSGAEEFGTEKTVYLTVLSLLPAVWFCYIGVLLIQHRKHPNAWWRSMRRMGWTYFAFIGVSIWCIWVNLK